MPSQTFFIEGMTCASCAARLQSVLEKTHGVRKANVNYATESAAVDLGQNPSAQDYATLIQSIHNAGFAPRVLNETHTIEGMTCASCAARLTKVLQKAPGILSAHVNYATQSAYIARVDGLDFVEHAVTQAGFHTAAQESQTPSRAFKLAPFRRAIAFVVAGIFMTSMFAMMAGIKGAHIPPKIQLALAVVVQFFCGAPFYVSAHRALRARSANMDVLVALGTTAAFALSVVFLFKGRHDLYFESSASVIAFVLLGKWLEERAKKNANAALKEMRDLRPQRARLLRPKSQGEGFDEVEVALPSLSQGARILVRAGEIIPGDGEVVKGESLVDESLLTGESRPESKSVGSIVHGGSQNKNGVLEIVLSRPANDSLIERMVAAVFEAQSQKPAVQARVDKVSLIFVPVVMAIAALTFAGWMLFGASATSATINAVCVLVVACPCALGLATPVTLTASIASFSKAGIIVRNPDAFAALSDVTCVVFDKTGTLTEGQPQVSEVIAPNAQQDEVLALCAGAQASSTHPLSDAVRVAIAARGLEQARVKNAQELPGKGVLAQSEEGTLRVGKRTFAEEGGASFNEIIAQTAAAQEAGKGVFFVAQQDRPLGAIVVEDLIREEAKAVVASLARRFKIVMLTGDHPKTAEHVAQALGIDEVHAQKTPFEKAAFIKSHGSCAFVGDGVNDAQGLVESQFGIAMPSQNTIALGAADIALLKPDLHRVAFAFDLAKQTTRVQKQNLGWAFVYNTLGIPLAVAGLLTPMMAGAAMAFSSVSVVLNALRLLRPPRK